MRRVYFCILLSVLGTPVAAQPMTPNLTVMHQEAITRFRAGRYDEAIALYRTLADMQPENVNAKKDLMWALWNSEHFEEAGRVASDITKKVPNDVEARNVLSRVPATANRDQMKATHEEAVYSYQQGNYTKAIESYRRLAANNPRNPQIWRDLMWALWSKESYEEAAKVAGKILELRPGDSDASDALARLPEVIKQQEIALKRQRIEAINRMANRSAADKNYDEAVSLLRELVAMDPENPGYYNQLLSMLRKAGRLDEGLLQAKQMTAVHKNNPESWNWLATFQIDLKDIDGALQSSQYALALDSNQPKTRLAMGRLYVTMREFDHAVEYLKPALTADPKLIEGYPLLGKALFWTGKYDESVQAWEKAVQYYPTSTEYQFYWAQALYYSGKTDAARSRLQALYDDQDFTRAFDFLVNDALSHDEVGKAERMLAEDIDQIEPEDEGHVMKLASLYQQNGQKDKLLALLDRYFKVVPNHQPALLMKAATLFEMERFEEAERVYRRVHELNPYDTEAVRGLAECELSLNHSAGALQYVHDLRALDPTNAGFLLMEAQYEQWVGHSRQAKDILMRWIQENKNSAVLPIVLYHGLATSPDDPLLAYPYHMKTMTFEDQMHGLHEAGYTAVTAEDVALWSHGKKSLPKKPILITFDDGRLDSFQQADPILQRYGLKATMCAALVNMEGHRPPGFVPWQSLAAYQKTGRWDIQSHGDIAHIFIPIDAAGNQALFLSSKQWLEDQGRLETDEEFTERLRSDYASSRDKITKNIGVTPVAYAYPEGIYGQQGHCNTPKTEPTNQALVRRYFGIAFAQDRYGMNLQSRDPWHLNRHEPDPHWKGKDLVEFLHNKNPLNLAYSQLLDWAVWDGRTREAYHWLNEMKANGVSEPVLLAKESQIRFSAGDVAQGQALAQRAMMMESLPDVQKTITSALATQGPSWTPSFSYREDNQGRHEWTVDQALTSTRFWKSKWSLLHRHAEYFDSRVAKVIDNGIGAGVDTPLGLFHVLHIEGMQHFLSGGGQSTYSAQGKLDSKITDNLETIVSGGRSIYYTARALNHHVTDTYMDAAAKIHFTGPWQGSLRGRYLDLSDDNRRRTGQAEVSRSLWFPDHLRLLYRFSYDEMRFQSNDYYSPQSLRMHSFGPQISFKTRKQAELLIRYLPSYAAERGTNYELEQNVETAVQIPLGEKTLVRPSFQYGRTPSYRETTYTVEIQHVF